MAYLDTVCTIVTNEDMFIVIDSHAIRKLQFTHQAEAVDDGSRSVKDHNAHYTALDDDNAPMNIHCNTTRMLQNAASKSTQEVAASVKHLNLMSRTAFGHDNVTSGSTHCQSVWIDTVSYTHLTLPTNREV